MAAAPGLISANTGYDRSAIVNEPFRTADPIRIPPVDGVMIQEVGQVVGWTHVIDRDHIKLRIGRQDFKRGPSDPSQTIEGNHLTPLPIQDEQIEDQAAAGRLTASRLFSSTSRCAPSNASVNCRIPSCSSCQATQRRSMPVSDRS